jgi:DNA primase
VAVLPEGEDPDTFAKKVGAEAVQQLVKQARPLTEHLFTTLLPGGPGASFEEKMSALDRLKVITAQLPVGLVRSAFFGAMAKHFAIPASELEAALKSKLPQTVRAAPKAGPAEPPPQPMETLYAACVLRDRRLLARDEYRCFDELKHLGVRTLIAAIQSGTAPEEALYEASDVVKQALAGGRDQLPLDDQALEPAFLAIGRRLKLRSIEEQLARIARETAQTPGASELTDDARALLEQRGQLLGLKQRLLSQK